MASRSWTDPITTTRERFQRAQQHLHAALNELDQAGTEAKTVANNIENQKIALEEQARLLRKEVESLQSGAGDIVRKGQQLRERKAQIESLRNVLNERYRKLEKVINQRGAVLEQLDVLRENRFKIREDFAKRLNKVLGPRIHISVGRAGQFEAFSAAIAEILQGSGLRYRDLAACLAERLSPRELLEAADTNGLSVTKICGRRVDHAANSSA